MIKFTFEFIELFYSASPFLFGLIFYTILAIALSKNIKKHANKYYWAFGAVTFCYLIPFILRVLFKVNLPFNLGAVPVLGQAMNELSHAAWFVHPVLVLIMYMGAFSPKNKSIGKLMSIRKELSIIVGFPVLAHALKRVLVTFPGGWQFFFDNETYMQSPRVSSALGSGISSFAFVLGLVMTILFLVLWITSFDSVHKKMGAAKWKKVQKWSYGLYAMLFIHSMCLQVGGMISDNARMAKQASAPRIEMTQNQGHSHSHSNTQSQEKPQAQAQQGGHSHGPQQAQAQQGGHSHGGRPKTFSFEEWKPSKQTGRKIHIVVLLIVYISYLYFRLKKARDAKKRRQANS